MCACVLRGLRCCSHFSVQCVDVPGSWTLQIKADLDCLSTFRRFEQTSGWRLQQWIASVRSSPRLYRQSFCEHVWNQELRKSITEAPLPPAVVVSASLDGLGDPNCGTPDPVDSGGHQQLVSFARDRCEKVFRTKQALSVHLFRACEVYRSIRQFVDDRSICRACLVEFHYRSRLVSSSCVC